MPKKIVHFKNISLYDKFIFWQLVVKIINFITRNKLFSCKCTWFVHCRGNQNIFIIIKNSTPKSCQNENKFHTCNYNIDTIKWLQNLTIYFRKKVQKKRINYLVKSPLARMLDAMQAGIKAYKSCPAAFHSIVAPNGSLIRAESQAIQHTILSDHRYAQLERNLVIKQEMPLLCVAKHWSFEKWFFKALPWVARCGWIMSRMYNLAVIVPLMNIRYDHVLYVMTPYIITSAMCAVCSCKTKADWGVQKHKVSMHVITALSLAACIMGTTIAIVLHSGALQCRNKYRDPYWSGCLCANGRQWALWVLVLWCDHLLNYWSVMDVLSLVNV